MAATDTGQRKVFAREGLGYRFSPPGAPVALLFTRIVDRRDETTAEVQVVSNDGAHLFRRRINLLSSGRGSAAELAKELSEDIRSVDLSWKQIVRDGCESVLAAHRTGPPLQVVSEHDPEPPPLEWLCDGLILKNKANCWLGAGSTGKSTLAKAFCAYYATGYRFLGRQTERGYPLYLDWEDDYDSYRRVVLDVCRDLGVWPPPRLGYRSMRGFRLRDMVETLSREIDTQGVGLIVIDAIAAAGGAPGEYMSWESVALDLEQALGQLPPVTVLGIDHVTSDDHKLGGKAVPLKARGSERKYEMFRNQWSLVADQDLREDGKHVVSWTHTKINADTYRPEFVVEIVHRPGELSIVERAVESSPEAVERLPAWKRTLRYVIDQPGQTAKQIAEEVRGSDSRNAVIATRTELTRLVKRGLLTIDASGCYWPPAGPDAAEQENGRLPDDQGHDWSNQPTELPW